MSQPRILYVDDEKELVESMCELIRMSGHDAEGALNAADAMNRMQQLKQNDGALFDCVVCDWMMPGVDGIELLQTIRNGSLRATPFILVSGAVSYQALADAAKYDPDAVLLKPFKIGDLLVKIEEAAKRRAAKENKRPADT